MEVLIREVSLQKLSLICNPLSECNLSSLLLQNRGVMCFVFFFAASNRT